MPGGPLNLNSTNLPRPWSPRVSSPSGKILFLTVSLLVLIRYRVNRFTHVPYWSLCGILYKMSQP